MPEMDGYNFVKALRATDTGKRIPVIMYTSIQEEREKEKFFDLGIRHYLDKSCETDTLLQTVARAYVSWFIPLIKDFLLTVTKADFV